MLATSLIRKLIGPVFGLLIVSSVGESYAAVPAKAGDDLYSESLYLQQSAAEVPSSFASSAASEDHASAAPSANVAIESVAALKTQD